MIVIITRCHDCELGMFVDLVMSCSNSTASYLVMNTANMMVLEDSKACPVGRLQWWKVHQYTSITFGKSDWKKRTIVQCCSISISITLTIQDDPKPQLIDH